MRFGTKALLFQQTFLLRGKDPEFEQEKMFESEDVFQPHEVEVPEVIVDTGHLGETRLIQVRSTGHTLELEESRNVSVLVVRRGRIVVDTGRETFTAMTGDVLLFSPNARTTHVLPDRGGQFEAYCALCKTEALIEVLPALWERPVERRFGRKTLGPHAQSLVGLLGHLFAEGSNPTSVLGRSRRAIAAADVLFVETLGALIGETVGPVPVQKPPSRRDHALVREAEDLMRDRFSEAISTRGIATHLGISPRRLQVAFENARNVTPLNALLSVRLEIARERLANAGDDETVTDIAMECGFSNPSRFARAFSAAYGELPSQRLRRRI